VPTVAESGVPGYEAYVWLGLLAPKATPATIIDKVYREVLAVLATDDVRRYMANASIELVGSSPTEFGAFFRMEKERWAKIVRETGAKVD
jgi:tripartite-type tricarboxylate transporter receptor subunit TctC